MNNREQRERDRSRYMHVSVQVGHAKNELGRTVPARTPKGQGKTAKRTVPKTRPRGTK